MELGVDEGLIVARTDSLGAGLTKQIAFTREAGDIGDQYNSFLDCEEVDAANLGHGDVLISRDGKLMRPKRLPRSEEHTSELQSLMRNSYAVFCLQKKKT